MTYPRRNRGPPFIETGRLPVSISSPLRIPPSPPPDVLPGRRLISSAATLSPAPAPSPYPLAAAARCELATIPPDLIRRNHLRSVLVALSPSTPGVSTSVLRSPKREEGTRRRRR